MNETVKVLQDARARIARGWCQNALALDAAGQGVSPNDGTAVRWCMVGTLHVGTHWDSAWAKAFRAIQNEIAGDMLDRISTFNNTHSREEVLEIFDRAIAKLKPPLPTTTEQVAALWARVEATPLVEGDIRSPEYVA